MVCLVSFICINSGLYGDYPDVLRGIRILLDPGHGVMDSNGKNINKGAHANSLKEQDVVVDIAEILGSKLALAGCEVYYTRNKNRFWRINDNVDDDNYNRAYEAEGYGVDAFIRLHLDWNRNKKVNGARTFYLKRSSQRFAETIQNALVRNIKRKDLGAVQNWYKGLEEISMPGVLIEFCFISNPEEASLLKKKEFLENCAQGVYEGVVEYFTDQSFASYTLK